MTYEKAKRKNNEFSTSIGESVGSGLASAARFGRYFGVVLPAKGLWWLTKNAAKAAGWFIKNAGGGAWHYTKAAASYFWHGTVWMATAPFLLLRRLFIEALPEFENSRQAAAYRLVRRYYRRRQRFLSHLFAYGAGMMLTLINYLSIAQNRNFKPHTVESALMGSLAFAGVWAMVVLFHFVRMRLGNAEDEALANVLERDYGQTARASSTRGNHDYHGRLANDYEAHLDEEGVAYYEEDQYHKNKR